VIKVSDISAYFTGLAFGKTSLIPKVSPKKTWEGTIGGVLGSGLAGVLLVGLLVPALCPQGMIAELRLMQTFVFGLVMSAAGQFGDLVESLFKRDSGAKDSARLVPDFGGILDLIDSPLFALPAAWALLRWWTQAA
jgi:phosphatidate cytidylyltransferase